MESLDLFTPLFAYPGEHYRAHAQACAEAAGSEEMQAFAERVAPLGEGQLQEAFIQAFDLNPASTLEIGWHLFGERYERGELLVNLRGQLREAGIQEIGELPDHLLHVLPLTARLAPGDARAFADTFVLPALEKIAAGLPTGSIFGPLVSGLTRQLRPAVPQESPADGPRGAFTTEHREDTEAAGCHGRSAP
jgi:nitrate reductase molybdenum cofactor assembly chaperone NarJ/NarW